MGKHVFETFNLREISAVTMPAQKGAKMMIMKRDFTADDRKRLADSGAAMPDGSFPIETEADLNNAIRLYGHASDPAAAKKHIIARARAIGCIDCLPKEWGVMKSVDDGLTEIIAKALKAGKVSSGARTFSEILQINEDQQKAWKVQSELYPIFNAINDSVSSILGDTTLTMTQKTDKVNVSVKDFLGAIRAKFPDVEEEIAKALSAAGVPGLEKGTTNMSKELEDKVAKLSSDLATSNAALATATALATMTDDQKAFYAKLGKDDKPSFEKATPEERASTVAKAREGDETITVEGTVIRKSEIGASMFAVIKSQQASIDASKIAIKAAQSATEDSVFKSRAKVELVGLPGTDDEKLAVIKAIAKDPVADKAFTAIIKAAGKAMSKLFSEFGRSDAGGEGLPDALAEGTAEAEINKLAKEVQKSDSKLSFEQAVAKVLDQNPALYAQYDAENTRGIDDPGDE